MLIETSTLQNCVHFQSYSSQSYELVILYLHSVCIVVFAIKSFVYICQQGVGIDEWHVIFSSQY